MTAINYDRNNEKKNKLFGECRNMSEHFNSKISFIQLRLLLVEMNDVLFRHLWLRANQLSLHAPLRLGGKQASYLGSLGYSSMLIGEKIF